MFTQITCPNCQTPYPAEVHQLIDVRQNPELKTMLLSGQLNVAVCPNCGAGGQLSAPLVYHDPDHELMMIYVPQELNLAQQQREEIVGTLTRQIMESTPQEQRRAYMFQPQQVLSMQTFMENVLETEGVTKEMIARQKKQSELLRTLVQADKDVQDYLLKDRASEIDETFFAMLQQAIDQVSQMEDTNQAIPFINLRARLMTETAVGREIEKRQIAMHKFNQDAKKADGISEELLLKHVLLNQEDPETIQVLVNAGQQALNYQFFQLLTAEIEAKEAAGEETAVSRLSAIRTDLLAYFEDRQQKTQQMLEGAQDVLDAILEAPDRQAAIREYNNDIDDVFMYVLSVRLAEAEQAGNTEIANALDDVQQRIVQEMESQLPPEVRMMNQLISAEGEAAQNAVLDDYADMLTPQLLQLVDAVRQQSGGQGNAELDGRLREIRSLIEARL